VGTLPALHPTVERPPLTSVGHALEGSISGSPSRASSVARGIARHGLTYRGSLIKRCWHPFARSFSIGSPPGTGFISACTRRPSLRSRYGGRNSAKKPGHFIDGRNPARSRRCFATVPLATSRHGMGKGGHLRAPGAKARVV